MNRYGPTFWKVLELARSGKYTTRAAIAREIGVTRARVGQILEVADRKGILPMPLPRCPARAAGPRKWQCKELE
jgi:hypothetical protein